jgi:hypothetical protein
MAGMFGGGPRGFVVGANLPWIGYGTDIGRSAWHPGGGLGAQPAALDLLDQTYAALARDGVVVVRQFLLCDLRSGVTFNEDGMPTGLDESVLPDMDALLTVARRHGIQLICVLLDFHLSKRARLVNGVQLGGRARLIVDPDARTALMDRVLRPLVERYRDDPQIVAWDVLNEPEWCVPRIGQRGIRFAALQQFLGQAVECVRTFARQPITIGCAHTTRLGLVKPLGLDFYQVHWYERFGWRALQRPVADLALDRPVILGEFPGRHVGVADVLGAAQEAGYAGALVWSVLSHDAQSAYPAGVATWAGANSRAGHDRPS